jgi:hypothetical protein
MSLMGTCFPYITIYKYIHFTLIGAIKRTTSAIGYICIVVVVQTHKSDTDTGDTVGKMEPKLHQNLKKNPRNKFTMISNQSC